MNKQTVAYFTAMQDILTGYTNIKKARKAQKQTLIESGNWDKVKAMNEEDKNIKAPFNNGYMAAFRAFEEAKTNEIFVATHVDIIEVNDLPWPNDAHDFVSCLREACVNDIAVTDQSTALMEVLHKLGDEGCHIEGLCKVEYTDVDWDGKETKKVRNGIVVRIQ